MEEKIKISLPKSVLDLLKKDCADFKISKRDGSPNFNAFINVLVENYYEDFSAKEESLHDEIKGALSAVPSFYQEKAFYEIVKIFAKKNDFVEERKQSTTFSFKPTKQCEPAILYIRQIILKTESLSSFFRRMFISYAQKTKTEREKIIHCNALAILQKAIARNVKACLQMQNGDVLNAVTVYAVAPSKDEFFNYALIYNDKNNVTIRLSSIKNVTLLPLPSSIPPENKDLFDRQIESAVQYPMYNTDKEPIRVQLTEKGKKLFEKIYLYRPTPTKIEGDVYTFNCSANQLLYYFERFGDSALILSPKKLGIFMRNYYHFALKKYRTLYKTKD